MMAPEELKISSPRYPLRITRVLQKDAPKQLAYIGNLSLVDTPSVGFCGSRKATTRGLEAAYDCAAEVARRGCTVVSGNAPGVDLEAHRAALENGGSTILVLPEGLDRFRIRKPLKAGWSWDRVLVISQWDPKAIWRSYQAMARNNTIIGLANAMVVIEAGTVGGTWHAGEKSLLYGVPLFVVEYMDMSSDAAGNAELLRRGGVAIRRSREDGKPNVRKVVNTAIEDFSGGARQSELGL